MNITSFAAALVEQAEEFTDAHKDEILSIVYNITPTKVNHDDGNPIFVWSDPESDRHVYLHIGLNGLNTIEYTSEPLFEYDK